MSFQLRLDEMLCVLEDMNHPRSGEFIRAVEVLGDNILNEICSHLEIIPGNTTFDMGLVAAPLFASEHGQELPMAIRGYDNDDEWGQRPSMKL